MFTNKGEWHYNYGLCPPPPPHTAKMPPNSEQYYGLSYFALQLNELLEKEEGQLPCTDCRFRPDQRLLEDGHVKEAEAEKRRVEQVCPTSSHNVVRVHVYISYYCSCVSTIPFTHPV